MIQNSACLSNNNELETQVIVIQLLPVRFVVRKTGLMRAELLFFFASQNHSDGQEPQETIQNSFHIQLFISHNFIQLK